ncbi:MAG: hypothetical protein A2070_09280 [Bdellovibrionales bacterium GWC1_52_8]|nr:MAG: hypothetical protein A2Z97_02050 [Bdellovibrionales bacterium GWB1_52_6]OFZ41782.1 MAG: hypothetical protein A2070_09280 [Bdellovibrionales bacterium GWC1_52_8]
MVMMVSVQSFGSEFECTNTHRDISTRSKLYSMINRATENANFGARDLHKVSSVRDITARKFCVSKAEGIEWLGLRYLVRVKASEERYESLFFCRAQAQRQLVSARRFGNWQVSRPLCRDHVPAGPSGPSDNSSDTGSPSPDEIDDGSGNDRGSGGGPDDVDDGTGYGGGSGGSPSPDDRGGGDSSP